MSRYRPTVHALPQETHDTVRVDDAGQFWDAEGRPLHIDCFDPDQLVVDPTYRTETLITPTRPLKGWKAFLHAMFGPTTDEERNRWSAY